MIVQMGFSGKYSQFCYRMNEIYSAQSFHRTKSMAPRLVKTWSPTRLSLMLNTEQEWLMGTDDIDFLKLPYQQLPQMLKSWIEEAVKSDCGLKNFAKKLI